ncbi:hypothetical protein [Clostridium sardiniense]|uniref:hypothetical protein n=1 Tax=Clostridium sardiniense TaxID=29369 RepID=UPI001957A297|nr:hypothetical protein [Clostridium sardiniense]MBM7836241.1 hypothetical protein [Clostridium sardiniense]
MVNYVFLVIGVFLLGLGILMCKGLVSNMIAGFDDQNDDKLIAGKWVGTNIVIMSFIIILSSIIVIIAKIENPLIIFCISMGSIVIFSLRCALLYNKKV